jgi:hypothetical protein
MFYEPMMSKLKSTPTHPTLKAQIQLPLSLVAAGKQTIAHGVASFTCSSLGGGGLSEPRVCILWKQFLHCRTLVKKHQEEFYPLEREGRSAAMHEQTQMGTRG